MCTQTSQLDGNHLDTCFDARDQAPRSRLPSPLLQSLQSRAPRHLPTWPSPRLRPREHTACSGRWTWGWRAVLGGDQPGAGVRRAVCRPASVPAARTARPTTATPKLNFFEIPEVGGRATRPRPQSRLVTQHAAANRAPPAFALLRGRPMGAGLAAASCPQARRPRGRACSLCRPQRRNRRDPALRAPAQVSAAATGRWDGRPRPSGQVGAAEAAERLPHARRGGKGLCQCSFLHTRRGAVPGPPPRPLNVTPPPAFALE